MWAYAYQTVIYLAKIEDVNKLSIKFWCPD